MLHSGYARLRERFVRRKYSVTLAAGAVLVGLGFKLRDELLPDEDKGAWRLGAIAEALPVWGWLVIAVIVLLSFYLEGEYHKSAELRLRQRRLTLHGLMLNGGDIYRALMAEPPDDAAVDGLRDRYLAWDERLRRWGEGWFDVTKGASLTYIATTPVAAEYSAMKGTIRRRERAGIAARLEIVLERVRALLDTL